MEHGPFEDVVPIKNKDIPASYVSLPEGIISWRFHIFFNFHPYLGKIPILTNIFQMG